MIRVCRQCGEAADGLLAVMCSRYVHPTAGAVAGPHSFVNVDVPPTVRAAEHFAAAVAIATSIVERQHVIDGAAVSGVEPIDGGRFAVTVKVSDAHVLRPVFRAREDADTYREVVGAVLDRAA